MMMMMKMEIKKMDDENNGWKMLGYVGWYIGALIVLIIMLVVLR
jgi:hypothetical protein